MNEIQNRHESRRTVGCPSSYPNRPPRRPCVWPLESAPTLLSHHQGEREPGIRDAYGGLPASAVRTCSARRKPRRPCQRSSAAAAASSPDAPACVSPSPVSGCVWGQRMPAGSADTDRPPRSCWSSSATSRSYPHASASLSPLLPHVSSGVASVAGVVAWSARPHPTPERRPCRQGWRPRIRKEAAE